MSKPVNERLVNNNHRPGLQALNEQAAPAQEERKHNRLASHQEFKLWTELKNQLSTIEAEGMTEPQCAEYMSTVLSFPVNANHIASAKRATGVKWVSKSKRKTSGLKKGNHGKTSRVLSSAILELYKRCGETPPEEFTQWINEVHNPGWSRAESGHTEKEES